MTDLVGAARKCVCPKQLALAKIMIASALLTQSPIKFRELVTHLPSRISAIAIALAMLDLQDEKKIRVFYRLVDCQGNLSPESYDEISDIPKEQCKLYPVDIITFLEKV